MGKISSQILFLTTSPRTPEKMFPEIELLVQHFEGRKWDKQCQLEYMEKLKNEETFNGNATGDPAFSARDRINRAPKSLGFVELQPQIQLTPAGKELLTTKNKSEVLLRQLLKFQIPSPYHKPTRDAADFCVKPYLELLRLIYTLGTLKFDELQIYALQLTNYHNFDAIVEKIRNFRIQKEVFKGKYAIFKAQCLKGELLSIFKKRINKGKTRTRESQDNSLKNFLKTQANNMRDYADAFFRYIRATGLVAVSHIGKSLSIIPERLKEVQYILKTIEREPIFVDDLENYMKYLGNAGLPRLLTDDKKALISIISKDFPAVNISSNATVSELKEKLNELLTQRKKDIITKQISELKEYSKYNEIQSLFEQIKKNELYDTPLMLEWNIWRAMTMLDGGNILANLSFDDQGNPMTTASGNMSDIVCDYGNYLLCVEVTMSTGQRQYEMEGEPVMRHLGQLKKSSGKPCYCLFIAPNINEACIAHFYVLHKVNVELYGGKSVIVPLPLNIFQKMLETSHNSPHTPVPAQVLNIFKKSEEIANNCDNEKIWYKKLTQFALRWLD